ncbi:subtilisin-like protein [Rhizodiscina lignyota]|uniref:Subtilisin-like protein n=1 Tax=Rhizodiscina lignyota TaxID=1504668 RepID=A0A9P4IKS3_9PEZI|nr:subtilisin-like protein [Rhizodiscina lignyota]
MIISYSAFAAFTLLLCNAAALPDSHAVHEKREATSERWIKRDRVNGLTTLPVRIGLAQSNLDRGYDYLLDVSHPDSPNYGKHWTAEEVAKKFAPSEESIGAVRDWLTSSGIDRKRISHTTNMGWLTFHATVQEMENLLHTEYYHHEDSETGQVIPACDLYHIPNHITEHVDFVTPGVGLNVRNHPQGGPPSPWKRGINDHHEPAKFQEFPHEKIHNNSDLATCDIAITPACIRALYDVPLPTTAVKGNTIGIFENGNFYAQEDLDLFFSNFTPYIKNGTHPILDSIDGGVAPVPVAQGGGESALDLELAYPLIHPQQVTLFQVDDINYSNGSLNASGIYNDWLDAIDGSYCTYSAFGETGNDPSVDPVYPDPLPGGWNHPLQCGVYKPTNVMSVSYSAQEYNHPVNYQKRMCNEFMKLGLQGHSIFFSSGDTGVAGRATDPAPNGCLGPNHTIFNSRYPNSCPYLTVVGATKVYPGHTVFEPESAANDLAGAPYKTAYSPGGGFSNIFPIPPWQETAVASYFKHHNPPYPYYSGNEPLGYGGGLYNRSGRGYPDVAANGDNIAVYSAGKAHLSGGTSASTPMFASIVNRINEERLLRGKSPVGFINPVLYAHPEVLNDIKNGSNPGCNTNGFTAVDGWDPLTGLGTPNFPKMLELFLRLP